MNTQAVNIGGKLKLAKIRRLFLIEFSVALFVINLIFMSLPQGISQAIAYGFMTFFIPNVCFFWRSFRWSGAKYAVQVAKSFYLAESSKFALSLIMFAVSFKMLPSDDPISSGVLILTYVGFFIVHQIALFTVMAR